MHSPQTLPVSAQLGRGPIPVDYRIETIYPACFLRWFAVPTPETSAAVLSFVVAQFNKDKRKVHLVTLVGENAPVPDAEGRRTLKNFLTALTPYCHCNRLVFEGSSIKATMQRTVIDATLMLARLTGAGVTKVHATGEEAVKAVMAESKTSPASLISQAKAAGFF